MILTISTSSAAGAAFEHGFEQLTVNSVK